MAETSTESSAAVVSGDEYRRVLWQRVARNQVAGPLVALLLAIAVFSLGTSTFLRPNNLSLIFQQSMVTGTLAVGETLIILTGGIDLACAAVMVLGQLVAARYALAGGNSAASSVVALFLLFVVGGACGALAGGLVTRLRLPPFIVTLGLLTVYEASARLYTNNNSYPVSSDLLIWPGNSFTIAGAAVPYGVFMWIGLVLVAAYVLTQTAAGRHVYAVGDNVEAARRSGINVRRLVLTVYISAGLIYGFAGWIALGRLPFADPSAYQGSNLDAITAVVIGGTSLFGGRGSVAGTLIGVLIVTVLANGLTQAGIDSNYQQVATGALVIGAVSVDQIIRRRDRT